MAWIYWPQITQITQIKKSDFVVVPAGIGSLCITGVAG
jgi:hypothetical protein